MSPALLDLCISTHSLTRRLTSVPLSGGRNFRYFNSQPHKEADRLSSLCPIVLCYFNSQPHKEADHSFGYFVVYLRYFNSQPHKEADRPLYVKLLISSYFNSQPHKEADFSFRPTSDLLLTFQLTASQGG